MAHMVASYALRSSSSSSGSPPTQEEIQQRVKTLEQKNLEKQQKLKEDYPKIMEEFLTIDNMFENNNLEKLQLNIFDSRESILQNLKERKIKLTPVVPMEMLKKYCKDMGSGNYSNSIIYIINKNINHEPLKGIYSGIINYNGKQYVLFSFSKKVYNSEQSYLFDPEKFDFYRPSSTSWFDSNPEMTDTTIISDEILKQRVNPDFNLSNFVWSDPEGNRMLVGCDTVGGKKSKKSSRKLKNKSNKKKKNKSTKKSKKK
jgi:hypothetical protein